MTTPRPDGLTDEECDAIAESVPCDGSLRPIHAADIERERALIRAATAKERSRCAKLCEAIGKAYHKDALDKFGDGKQKRCDLAIERNRAAEECAAAIRNTAK